MGGDSASTRGELEELKTGINFCVEVSPKSYNKTGLLRLFNI